MSNSNKKIHLDDLLNKSRKVYEQFDKSKGSSRLDFGSIYLTRPSEKGISNIVTIIDILKDDDQSNNKYVNVVPISLDIKMAADDDLILEGIENNGPLPCDITIHAGMQMTISIDDISSYYAHLSKMHEKKLKKLLLLLEGDYSIDVETLSIGSPIISPEDYRVKYRNNLVRDLEYLTIPAFVAVSDYLRENKPEPYKDDYFEDLINFYNDYSFLELLNKYSGHQISRRLNEQSRDETLNKIIHDYNKKGIKTIIPSKPNEPDLIIEDKYGNREPLEIKIKDRFNYIPSFPVEKIWTFNWQRHVNTNSKAYKLLRDSIKRNGIRSPLHISFDNGCIDGGRRFAVARDLKIKTVPVIKSNYAYYSISNTFNRDYKNQIKKVSDYIRLGKNDKSFEIIDAWEKKPLPKSNFNNPYRGILEWMVYYANGDIDGLYKVNDELNNLVDKNLNHIDVDKAITITNGRIFQLDGKPDQAIEQYQKLDTKDFMIKYKIFTDPLIDCHLKLGDDVTASRIANENPRLIFNRFNIAEKASQLIVNKQIWMDENISAAAAA